MSHAGATNPAFGRSVPGCKSEWVHCNVHMVLWPSGEGSSLTRRRSVVRVHPGLLRPRYANRQSGLA